MRAFSKPNLTGDSISISEPILVDIEMTKYCQQDTHQGAIAYKIQVMLLNNSVPISYIRETEVIGVSQRQIDITYCLHFSDGHRKTNNTGTDDVISKL